jgi:hypothetical protein
VTVSPLLYEACVRLGRAMPRDLRPSWARHLLLWERECASEWAARSVSKLHPQLGPMDVAHVTRVEGTG